MSPTTDTRFAIDACIAGSVGLMHRSAGHGDMDVNDLDEVLEVESFPSTTELCALTFFIGSKTMCFGP